MMIASIPIGDPEVIDVRVRLSAVTLNGLTVTVPRPGGWSAPEGTPEGAGSARHWNPRR